ncbi:MAG: hypothetical protein R2697_06380 [Ilumatobacteraceae bacterium]
MQRLTDLAMGGGDRCLVVGTVVTGGGMAASAIGAAGASPAAPSRTTGCQDARRATGWLDYETFMASWRSSARSSP